jgi:hypothetical protein
MHGVEASWSFRSWDRMLDIGLYFKNEMLLMLERAWFGYAM